MPSFTLAPEFGYVILTATASVFELVWMGVSVGMARRKYKINYPKMYADKDDCEGDATKITTFNCIQRAHQNTLENYAQFLLLLLIGGVQQPVIASAAGATWLLGKVLYFIGYSTGDPKKRARGNVSYLGLLTLLGLNLQLAYNLITA